VPITEPSQPETSFEDLFGAVYPDLQRYFVRRLGPDDAEDAVAETLAAVLGKWDQAPPTLERQRAWAFGFARNKLREAERARSRDAQLVAASAQHAEPDLVHGPEDALAAMDRARHLLDQLPEAEREAVYWTVMGGLTSAEAAEVLGCSTSAITTRVSRGRARLKELLAAEAKEDGDDR